MKIFLYIQGVPQKKIYLNNAFPIVKKYIIFSWDNLSRRFIFLRFWEICLKKNVQKETCFCIIEGCFFSIGGEFFEIYFVITSFVLELCELFF